MAWKEFSPITKGAIIGGGGLVLYALYKTYIKKSNIKMAPVDYGQIPVIYTGPGGQPVKWDPDPLAKEISQNFEGWNLNTYPETARKISGLQPEQTKLLYNHYNAYYAEDYPTLTQLIDNEWPDWGGEYTKAVNHLKSFGLNENGDQQKFNWNQILEALTDPEKALNFPIKYPAIELDKTTRNTLTGAAAILAAGMIGAALIKTR
jgi:hypothetical protein